MPIKIERDDEFNNTLIASQMKMFEGNTRAGDRIHVSDITHCMRKSFYNRMYPEMNPITAESSHHFLRGVMSEKIAVELYGKGETQKPILHKNVIARPDILDETNRIIVELKNTVAGERMDKDDDVYKGYLIQLLYYLVMTGYTHGKLSIRYDQKELIWKYRDKNGNDWFMRPVNPKPVGAESWKVTLPEVDVVRDALLQDLEKKSEMLTQALEDNTVVNLPRVPAKKFNFKCKGCPYKERCYNEDGESPEAAQMREAIDILEIPGFVETI